MHKMFRSLALTTALTATLLATPTAQAEEGVYLLQLGSFESKAEAKARWDILREQYPSLFKNLSVRLQDVTLPPDNFTVYRTQAGLLNSHSDAQAVCDRLSARNDECYVVETAMFMPDQLEDAPTAQAVAPTVSVVDNSIEVEQALRTAQARAQAESQPITSPHVWVPQAVLEEEVATALQAAQTTAQIAHTANAAPIATADLPWDGAASAAGAVGTAIASQAASTAISAPIYSQNSPKTEEEGSFWSFLDVLNPFSDESESKPVKKAPLSAPTYDLYDIDPPKANVERPAAPAIPPQPERGLQEVEQALIQAQRATPSTATIAVPTMPTTAPKVATSQKDASFWSGLLPWQDDETTQPATEAAEGMPRTIAPPIMGAPPAPLTDPAAQADVRVAEAIRVPLSEQQLEALSQQPSIAQELRAQGLPSQSTAGIGAGSTQWAQIGYFADQQSALRYWDDFKRQNPTFPTVRVRVTSPYSPSQTTGRAALRVGPFDQKHHILDLCDEVASKDIHCIKTTDLGGSATAGSHRQSSLQNRYMRQYKAANLSAQPMYWVHLGGFDNPQAAQERWKSLQLAYRPLFNEMEPNIAPPNLSSSQQPVFRLRTGPYPLRRESDTLCSKLRARGGSCLTVFGR